MAKKNQLNNNGRYFTRVIFLRLLGWNDLKREKERFGIVCQKKVDGKILIKIQYDTIAFLTLRWWSFSATIQNTIFKMLNLK